MMKGSIYSRRVKKEEAAVPAVGVRQLSDQGEYPLGLLCQGRHSGTRGVPAFDGVGHLVLVMSALLPGLSQAHVAFCVWCHVLSLMLGEASLMPAGPYPVVFWKLLEDPDDVDALCAQKVVWSLPCRQGIGTIPLQSSLCKYSVNNFVCIKGI
ncbi:hypothetical protein HanRHA438_Chr13g0592341 [Helianthus annuus]|nr:hypothetical protein HanRHA438_Chr13g0592341 [Helianthus annuus]